MRDFLAALWAEALKARRSKITPLTAGGFMILPLVGGLFMLILKDPEKARALGIISLKAQLAGGVADWPTFFGMLNMGSAIGGAMLFAIITAWVFGREYSDHTAKEWLALPTSRAVIIAAKFALCGLWMLSLSLIVFAAGLGVGAAVNIPGWTSALGWASFGTFITAVLLTILLTPCVALFASMGRGYLPPLGWAFFTMVLAQIAGALGWGDRFPWTVPGLLSGMAGPGSELIGVHSYVLVILVSVCGTAATFAWWLRADQTR